MVRVLLWGSIGALLAYVRRGSPEHLDRPLIRRGLVPCPHCAEFIRPEANVCTHCRCDVRGDADSG